MSIYIDLRTLHVCVHVSTLPLHECLQRHACGDEMNGIVYVLSTGHFVLAMRTVY